MSKTQTTDEFTEYATAFYGEVPASQLNNLREPLMRLVMIFISDLRAKFQGIDNSKIHRAVVSGLARLNELGAKHPNIHRAENGMYIEAFQHACIRVRSIDAQDKAIQENRKREQEEARAMETASDHSKVASALYNLFSKYKQHYAENDAENPAVAAYKHLVKNDLSSFDLGGFAYYVVMIKIPQEHEIYWNDEVIQAVNDHPRLGNRKFGNEVHPVSMAKGSIGSFLRGGIRN